MPDVTLATAALDLYRAGTDADAAQRARSSVDALLAAEPPPDTPAGDAWWQRTVATLRAVIDEPADRPSVHATLAAKLAGMKNVLAVLTPLMAREPTAVRAAREAADAAARQRHWAERDRRDADHRAARIAAGLAAEAGTGAPIPAVALFTPDWNAEPYDDLPVGHSRLGGVPDLPPGAAWPTFDGKRMPFIAQVNVADFPAAHGLLPADGHLFAFVLDSNDPAHRPPPTAVFLHRGPAAALVRAARPAANDIWDPYDTGEPIFDPLPATPARPPGIDPSDEPAATVFGHMQAYYGKPGEVADAYMADGTDWITLMEVRSVGTMQWSDSGSLYLLVRRVALAALDFSGVLAAVCSS